MLVQTRLGWGGEGPRFRFCRRGEDAFFTSSLPSSSYCLGSCHLKVEGRTTFVEVWDEEGREGTRFSPLPGVRDVPLLLSNLQKAVRRGLPSLAASSALELSHADFTSLARRLPIVAVEDVRPNSHLPFCVWVLVALSCGYEAKEEDVARLVRVASALASDVEAEERPSDTKSNSSSNTSSNAWKEASARGDDVAMSILVRSAFGGMKGDVSLLLAFGGADLRKAPLLPLPTWDVPRLSPSLLLLEAVDFHCQPSLLKTLSSKTGIEESDVKAAVWEHNSKPNFRRPVTAEDPDPPFFKEWAALRADLKKIQTVRIKSAFV